MVRPLIVLPKSLRPRLKPCCSAFALPETGPVSGTRYPTLIGEWSFGPPELEPPPQAVTTTARAARTAERVPHRLAGSFTSSLPPVRNHHEAAIDPCGGQYSPKTRGRNLVPACEITGLSPSAACQGAPRGPELSRSSIP